MKFSEFETQMERLKRVFGSVKYPVERTDAIFQTVKIIPNEAFENQVTAFIAERDKAPFLRDFVESFSGLISDLRKQEISERLKTEADCWECRSTGVSIFYSRENSFSYAFQCHCKRGNMLNPSLPKKYPGMDKIYFNHNEWVTGKVKKQFLKVISVVDLGKKYGGLQRVDFQNSI